MLFDIDGEASLARLGQPSELLRCCLSAGMRRARGGNGKVARETERERRVFLRTLMLVRTPKGGLPLSAEDWRVCCSEILRPSLLSLSLYANVCMSPFCLFVFNLTVLLIV